MEHRQVLEASLQRLQAQKRAKRWRRLLLLPGGVLTLALWYLFSQLGYPGCGIIFVPVGVGTILIWVVENIVVYVIYGDEW